MISVLNHWVVGYAEILKNGGGENITGLGNPPCRYPRDFIEFYGGQNTYKEKRAHGSTAPKLAQDAIIMARKNVISVTICSRFIPEQSANEQEGRLPLVVYQIAMENAAIMSTRCSKSSTVMGHPYHSYLTTKEARRQGTLQSPPV